MKYLAFAVLAVLLTNVAALAQQPPGPPGPPSPPDQRFHQQFEAMHSKMAQIHSEARGQMLAALSASHKQFLATVVGDLAIANAPDFDAAARQIDAALSPGEKDAILKSAKTAWDKSRTLMESNMPPAQDGNHPMMMRDVRMAGNNKMTAGQTLLQMAMGFGPMNMRVSSSMEMHP